MTANELVTKAIRETLMYSGHSPKLHREYIDRMASTLSAGLIVVTEERLQRLLIDAFYCGVSRERGNSMEGSYKTASRIMRKVKGETK